MQRTLFAASLVILLAVPSLCFAEMYSIEGNEPQSQPNYKRWQGLVEVVNQPSRQQLVWCNGWELLSYAGDTVHQITTVEFLSDIQHGVGTRFRETRLMNDRKQTVELEVAEYVENDRVRMISDAGGTILDTLFTVSQSGDNVDLVMQMDIKPHTFFA